MAYDVVIVPSLVQAEAWRKTEAGQQRGGLFGRTVATFDAWIADLWELHGDGRAIVDSLLRRALMQGVVDRVEKEQGCELVGIAPVAARCVQQAAGVERFELALQSVKAGDSLQGVSEQERAFLEIAGLYKDDIRDRGLVELGDAAAVLAQRSKTVFPQQLNVLVAGLGGLSWVQEQFFALCPELNVAMTPYGFSSAVAQATDGSGLQSGVRKGAGSNHPLSDAAAGGVGRAPEGVKVQFAFPSGRLAQPGLIADMILGAEGARRFVVTCANPHSLFLSMEGRLAERGCCVRLQATKPFSQTDFGRAFLACCEVAREGAWVPALSDAVAGFFSGFPRSKQLLVDKELRGNRIARKSDEVLRLEGESQLFSYLMRLSSEVPDAEECENMIGAFEARVRELSHRQAAWRAEQQSALRRLRAVMAAARLAGVGIDACVDMLGQSAGAVAVRSSLLEGRGEPRAEVLVTDQRTAVLLQPGCCDVVIIADMTSEDYPVAEKDDALNTLFSALGLVSNESALERARRDFGALLRLPAQRVILCRPLGDANADETYPAVMLEEFVDAYRDDPSNASEVDNDFRLPKALQSGLVERGEELLFANACAGEEALAQSEKATIEQPALDYMEPYQRESVAPKRYDSSGNPLDGLCPSPSQIEAYLECPYQWFVNRRLRVEALDEGFGPLEKGSFAHAALESFYRRFQNAGHAKVSSETLPEARELMRAVTDELTKAQYEREPGSGRLVASSELELREVAALCDQLENYLDYEAQLLPTFHPAFFEYEIDADHAVAYAGRHLVGTVDRIDVDDKGHAVIIDYKGSVNQEHEINGKGEGHCGKVQTRIYAQAVKRTLGLDVVAALYVSYGRKPAVAGAYDPRVVEAVHLPGIRRDRCACGLLEAPPDVAGEDYSLASLSFEAMLAETEAIVSRALARMEQGCVTPSPAYARVCEYCPVLACSKRGE